MFVVIPEAAEIGSFAPVAVPGAVEVGSSAPVAVPGEVGVGRGSVPVVVPEAAGADRGSGAGEAREGGEAGSSFVLEEAQAEGGAGNSSGAVGDPEGGRVDNSVGGSTTFLFWERDKLLIYLCRKGKKKVNITRNREEDIFWKKDNA